MAKRTRETKAKEKRAKTFQMRLTAREKRMFFRAATAASMEVASWARRHLRIAAQDDLKRAP